MARAPFEIAGQSIAAGSVATVHMPVSIMPDHTPVSLSVQVHHGKRAGPTIFVSAAVHGDEVIGVEIVRRLLRAPQLAHLRGTLLVVPVVNAFGFLNRSRYLPDRRDLNRCFPGHPSGSLGSRLAHIFLNEVVLRCDTGIDLHSAAIHRTNLP
ncbi:MAG: succinylglutamate desuccinylase/aspartoacylase family protein, partial [Roseobacter sp.]|nr:succinylglutamate desuccinylase/aspartoacylase family protein [Roseobacter sp.]